MFYLLKLYHDEFSADVELKPGLEVSSPNISSH